MFSYLRRSHASACLPLLDFRMIGVTLSFFSRRQFQIVTYTNAAHNHAFVRRRNYIKPPLCIPLQFTTLAHRPQRPSLSDKLNHNIKNFNSFRTTSFYVIDLLLYSAIRCSAANFRTSSSSIQFPKARKPLNVGPPCHIAT